MVFSKTTIAFLALVFSAVAAWIPPSVKLGYHSSRSPDIIVKPRGSSKPASSIRDISPMKRSRITSNLYMPSDSAPSALSALFSCATGLPPLSLRDSEVACAESAELFKKAKANIIFIVHGLNGAVRSMASQSLEELNGDDIAYLKEMFYPENEASIVATLATAQVPSVHGIVGDSWRNDDESLVDAYSSHDSGRLSPSIADALHESFKDSVFISAAMKKVDTFAFLPSDESSYTLAYFFENSEVIDANGKVLFAESDIIHLLENAPFIKVLRDRFEMEFFTSADSITIAGRGKSVTFKLSDNAHRALLVELLLSVKFAEQINLNLANDESPDLFSLTFSAVKSIRFIDEIEMSLYLIDSAITSVKERLSEVYQGRLSAQLLGISSSNFKEELDLAKNKLSAIPDLTMEFFPGFYASSAAMCLKFRSLLKGNFDVFCPKFEMPKSSVQFEVLEVSTNGTVPRVTERQIAVYQISLWLTIVLILTLILSIYAFLYMDIRRDQILDTRMLSSGKKVA